VSRRDDLRHLRVLYGRFARPYALRIGLAALLSAVAASLAALQPLALAPVLDATGLTAAPAATSWRELTLNNIGPSLLAWTGIGASASAWTTVGFAVGAYVALVVLANVTNFGNHLFVAWVRAGILRDLQSAVYGHLLRLPMSYFTRQRTGDLASRVMHDAVYVSPTVDAIVRDVLQGTLHLAIYGFLLVRTDPWLSLALVVVVAGHFGITRALRLRMRRVTIGHFDAMADVTGLLHEVFVSIRVVKAFVAERFEHARFVTRSRSLARYILRGEILKYVDQPVREVTDALGLALVLALAFGAVAAGRMTFAGMVLFVVLARLALRPVSKIAQGMLTVQNLLGASKALLDVLETAPTLVDGPRTARPLRDAIRLTNVRFAYQPGHEVVRGVDLHVGAGEMVALVGPSGAGKSTLADLILRLYDPTAGQVLYDGVDVREFTQESYRGQFGVVSQESLLFNASVAENIAYGRPVDRAEVERVARMAHAEEFITRLPQAYDTFVGDRGIRLSGGQRQRIAIARALYRHPCVLVLDEATSSLDSESERHVQAAIAEVIRNVTAVVIAHRLSTVTRADRICVIEDGIVAAEGTHDELLARSPLYRRLCEAQFGRGAVTAEIR